MTTKSEVMKKIIAIQKERRELQKTREKGKGWATSKELEAKLAESNKLLKALRKEYETAIDDEPKTYAKPE